MERISNYEKLCDQWAVKFLNMDHKMLLEKLPELKNEGNYFTLHHFDRKYGISLRTGEICAMEDDESVTSTEKLNIYTLLWYAKPKAALTGQWVPFSGLPDARPFVPAFQKGVIEDFAAAFSGHGDALAFAAEKMGGIRLSHSDVGIQLSGFACIPVQYLFWEGDEEFKAQANILFDAGSTGFIHVESMVSIATEGMIRLMKHAGVTSEKRGFSVN